MPTGYTAGVLDGTITEFRDYAMLCARNFGATVTMRDEPMSAEIPVFEPSTYHKDSLERCEKELEEFKRMSLQERRQMYASQNAERVEQADRYIAERNQQRERYERMLEKARAYVPPTEAHKTFGEFLVSQLEESIKFDCGTDFLEHNKQTVPFDVWEANVIETLERNIANHANEWLKEKQRTEGRNRWVAQLRESLNAPALT